MLGYVTRSGRVKTRFVANLDRPTLCNVIMLFEASTKVHILLIYEWGENRPLFTYEPVEYEK